MLWLLEMSRCDVMGCTRVHWRASSFSDPQPRRLSSLSVPFLLPAGTLVWWFLWDIRRDGVSCRVVSCRVVSWRGWRYVFTRAGRAWKGFGGLSHADDTTKDMAVFVARGRMLVYLPSAWMYSVASRGKEGVSVRPSLDYSLLLRLRLLLQLLLRLLLLSRQNDQYMTRTNNTIFPK